MKMPNKITSIVFIFFASLLLACSSTDKEKIHKELETEIEVLNKQLPIQITENIWIDSCTIESNSDLGYFYSITDSVAPSEEFFKQLESEVKEMSKTDVAMTNIRNHKLSAKYTYKDKIGNTLYSFTISPKDYE